MVRMFDAIDLQDAMRKMQQMRLWGQVMPVRQGVWMVLDV